MFNLLKIIYSLVFSLGVFVSVSTTAHAHIMHQDQVLSEKDILSQAQALAGQNQFDAALALLSQEDRAAQNGYEHRFLRVRILSWKGDYGLADREFNRLLADYPANADVLLAYGNLDYYQQNFTAAEQKYLAALSVAPDYQEVRNALQTVRDARAAGRKARVYDWRIDASGGVSAFGQSDLQDWDEQTLRVEYGRSRYAYHGRVNRYSRFGENDIELEAGIASSNNQDWIWSAQVGVTPDADFRADWYGGVSLGRRIKTGENGPVFVANLAYRFDDFGNDSPVGNIHNIQPELSAYFKNGVVLTGRLIATVQTRNENQVGWLASGSVPISDKWQIRAGYANAPDTVNGVSIDTESVFGGFTYKVNEQLDLNFNASREDREDVFIRNSGNVGFTLKY